MDVQLGQLYETPIVISDTPQTHSTVVLLRQINSLIASGRLLMDMAAKSEDMDLHKYGKSLFDEGMSLLMKVLDGSFPLRGAVPLDEEGLPDKLIILQQDPESLVEGFYQQVTWNEVRGPYAPLGPYAPREGYHNPPIQTVESGV